MSASDQLPIPYGWFGVAFSDEVKAGEVKTLHYFDQDLVMFRTEGGEVHVVEPYCPHLGAHLGYGGTVKGEHIACPFHGWEFSGDGVCEAIPYAKRIPPKVDGKQSLYSFPTVEVNQSIWVWYHPHRTEPEYEVVELPEMASDDWTELRHFDWTVNVHIQEAAENAADAAHFTYVHSSQGIPQGEVKLDGHLRHAQYHAQAPDIDEQGNIDQTGTKWRASVLETSNCGPGQTWQRFSGLFDTLMLGVVTPINAGQMHLRFAFTQRKGLNETQQLMANGLVEEIARQVEQDIPIWNNKIYRPEPNLCDGDGPIAQFRKWFSQFYA
jgi:3-ketosteroid 9alpha-monooxygenase subunit A